MNFQRKDINEHWPEYLYRELDEPERAQFVHYLQHSPEAKREEEQWREMLLRFDSMAIHDRNMEVPPELVFRVKRQIRHYQGWEKQTYRRIHSWVVSTAVACLLFICAGFFVYQQWPHVLNPSDFYRSFKTQAISVFYGERTLEMYQSEGMLEDTKQDNHEIVSNQKDEEEKTSNKKDPSS